MRIFTANAERDRLEKIQQDHLEILFTEARKFGIRYLFVGKGEICGCENKSDSGGTWPAMWQVAKNIGFPGSCGNHDQYQTMGSEYTFPIESYGGWDIVKNRKLSDNETTKKKFSTVVTGWR